MTLAVVDTLNSFGIPLIARCCCFFVQRLRFVLFCFLLREVQWFSSHTVRKAIQRAKGKRLQGKYSRGTMSRAPSPLRGPALWDWLRNESLEYRDSFGQYPICKTEAEFVSAVQAFANITMVPGTSRLTFKDGKCATRGDFIER